MVHPFMQGFRDEIEKIARKVVHFREKDVPEKAKEIYYAMKREPGELRERYGRRWKEVAARTALKLTK